MENIFWSGYSLMERHAAINALKGVVAPHGDLVAANLFSDLSIHLTIEIAEPKINALYAALNEVVHMNPAPPLPSGKSRERTIFLHITFAAGTGNLPIEVPAIPG